MKLERIELWALKEILDLPKTTPTPAIWYVTGHLMTSILIDKRQMLYLKTILDRPTEDWTRIMIDCLNRENIGWVKNIRKTLENYEIDKDFDEIKDLSSREWKRLVTKVT